MRILTISTNRNTLPIPVMSIGACGWRGWTCEVDVAVIALVGIETEIPGGRHRVA